MKQILGCSSARIISSFKRVKIAVGIGIKGQTDLWYIISNKISELNIINPSNTTRENPLKSELTWGFNNLLNNGQEIFEQTLNKVQKLVRDKLLLSDVELYRL